MKNYILKLLLLGVVSQFASLATAADSNEKIRGLTSLPSYSSEQDFEYREFPLISSLMVNYFKETAQSVKRKNTVNLDISLSGVYGGESFNLPLELSATDMPNPFTKDYVISLSPLLSNYLSDLKRRHEPKATIRVSMYFKDVPDHKENVNGLDTIEFS